MDVLPQIILVIICVVLSAFFSASETAFSTLNRIRMKSMADSGNEKAARTLKLVQNYDKLLSTILIGNNVVNIISASLATLIFTRFLSSSAGVTLSTVIMTVVVLIFGEISPKSLAKENAEAFSMWATPFLKSLMIILSPLNFLFMKWKKLLSKIVKNKDLRKVTPEELMTLVDEAQNEGGIDEHNGELIRSAIEFDDLDANDIITPRVDLVAVEKDTPLSEIGRIFMENTYSRLPVYEDSIDNIIGMVHEKDFFTGINNGETSLEPMIKNVIYVSGGIKISRLLRMIQQAKTHIAVIVDEFGGTEGIVTLEDILEELVGEIWDEHDIVENDFEQVTNCEYLVSGTCSLEDFFEKFRLPDREDDYESVTVGGWVMEELGRIPEPGDSFVYEGQTIFVTKTEKRHVIQIRVRLSAPMTI